MPIDGGKPSAAARAAAAAWIARLHADNRSAADERAFHDWMAEDPAHAAAFEEATQAYELACALRDLPRMPARAPVSRRAMFVGGGALAASVAAGAFILTRSDNAEAYTTEIGEQRTIALRDGAQLLLNTDTSVIVRDRGVVRSVQVERGQINLRLPAAPAASIEVAAREQRVLAHAGSLDIRCGVDVLSIFVADGNADFIELSGVLALRAGDRLRVSAEGVAVDRPSAAAMTAWQRAQAVFESQTLAEAIGEMNRYSRTKLQVEDPAIAALRLSGVYSVGDNAAFARSVALLLPVEAHVRGDVIALEPAVSSQ